MKEKFKQAFMDVAERFAQLSHAERAKVGAIIVKEGRIISIGYNGMPEGMDNVCEVDGVTKAEVIHAEANAFAKLVKSNESGAGADMFVTHFPCIHCAKQIVQSGISKVYYGRDYKANVGSGHDLLDAAGIQTEKVELTITSPSVE